MVVVQGSKVTLPTPCSLSSPLHTTSILFEPTSLSLALTHSDSSLSLYPSFSPSPSSSSLPIPQTLIPPPSSSSTFLLLQSSTNPNPSVLFLVSSPHRAGSQILLRFYLLNPKTNAFAAVPRVLCSQRDLRFESKLGVLLDAKHGASLKLAGSVNYFALYSVSCSKVWVFAVKMMVGHDHEDGIKLMRCAVIRCSRPVWSLSISFGFLLLGEENGVRIFALRRLVAAKRVGNLSLKNLSSKQQQQQQLPNGVVGRDRHGGRDRRHGEGVLEATCNGDTEAKVEKHGVAGRFMGYLYRYGIQSKF